MGLGASFTSEQGLYAGSRVMYLSVAAGIVNHVFAAILISANYDSLPIKSANHFHFILVLVY